MEQINANGGLSFGGAPADKGAELEEAATAFEAIFVRQMISAMRRTVSEGGLLPKSNGQQMFEGMLDEEWSKQLAGRENGLSQLLAEQLKIRMVAEQQSPQGGEDIK